MDAMGEGMMPVGRDRVREHSSPMVNERIDERTRLQVQRYLGRDAVEIGRRLEALEREWDIDRVLMANFALAGAVSSGLSLRTALRRRRLSGWSVLFGAQMGFLMLHALVGWCPPMVLFRRLGFRTQKEIDVERFALQQALGARGVGATRQ